MSSGFQIGPLFLIAAAVGVAIVVAVIVTVVVRGRK